LSIFGQIKLSMRTFVVLFGLLFCLNLKAEYLLLFPGNYTSSEIETQLNTKLQWYAFADTTDKDTGKKAWYVSKTKLETLKTETGDQISIIAKDHVKFLIASSRNIKEGFQMGAYTLWFTSTDEELIIYPGQEQFTNISFGANGPENSVLQATGSASHNEKNVLVFNDYHLYIKNSGKKTVFQEITNLLVNSSSKTQNLVWSELPRFIWAGNLNSDAQVDYLILFQESYYLCCSTPDQKLKVELISPFIFQNDKY
jgi:hypothetical protein